MNIRTTDKERMTSLWQPVSKAHSCRMQDIAEGFSKLSSCSVIDARLTT